MDFDVEGAVSEGAEGAGWVLEEDVGDTDGVESVFDEAVDEDEDEDINNGWFLLDGRTKARSIAIEFTGIIPESLNALFTRSTVQCNSTVAFHNDGNFDLVIMLFV